ncbi:hypothetical protein GEMRC1_008094 [Eukaryota sp. GEM-RC1]
MNVFGGLFSQLTDIGMCSPIPPFKISRSSDSPLSEHSSASLSARSLDLSHNSSSPPDHTFSKHICLQQSLLLLIQSHYLKRLFKAIFGSNHHDHRSLRRLVNEVYIFFFEKVCFPQPTFL